VLQNVYISLPYVMAARVADIDRNEEIMYVTVTLCIIDFLISSQRHTDLLVTVRLLTVGRALLRSENRRKQSPEVLARAYAHALFASRPRRFYLIGSDAHLASVISCLPRWLQDRLLPFFFHYPKPPKSTCQQ